MDFVMFQKSVLKEMRKQFDYELRLQQVEKLQGRSNAGLSVRPKDRSCAAVLNLNEYYRYYQQCGRLDQTLDKIAEGIRYAAERIPRFEDIEYDNYDAMKKLLVVHMVSASDNAEMLKMVPYTPYGDMALVYRMELRHEVFGTNSLLVTKDILKGYGIPQEQLHQDALAQAMITHPPLIRSMRETLEEMSSVKLEIPQEECPVQILTATVEGGSYGAAVIAYPGVLEKAAEQIGGDFYILPSSIHEVLFITDRGDREAESLNQMVYQVNRQEVEHKDRLSDIAYHYDSKEKLLESAVQFEERMQLLVK